MSFFGELRDGLFPSQQPWEKALRDAVDSRGLSTAEDLPRSVREQLLRAQVTADGPIEPDLNAYFVTIGTFGADALAPLIKEGKVVIRMEVEVPEWPYRKILTPVEHADMLRDSAIRYGWNVGE